MKQDYVQALIASLRDGMTVDTALIGLKSALAKKQHEKLYVSILLEVVRILEAEKNITSAEVRVARQSDLEARASDIKAALEGLGVMTETVVKEVVDETIIGGFVTTYNYQERDQSYRTALKSLYESITK